MQENKMGVMPEGKLLLSMSLPVMGSMLISALYNIVDSMFVARISDNALNAVSLSFPIQLLMISLATGIGVGLNVLLSHALGAGQQQRADSIATNSIFLSFVCWIAFAILGQLFSAPFLSLFTENKVVLSMGLDYLRICTGFSGGVFLLFTAERAGLNIILDPIFIFGYWGCPAFGVAGAAAATVIGQCVAAAVGLWLNHLLNHDIHLSFRGFRPGRAINLEICRVGLPAALIQALSTFMVAGMNAVLMPLHAAAVGFFGVYYKLQNFLYMPLYGMTNTLVPIIGYNLGAGKPNRIRRLAWQAVKFSLVLMGAGMVLFLLFPRVLLGLFGSEAFAYSGGLAAIRIIAPSFLPAGVILTFAGMLQGLGRSGEALLLSSLRQIIFLLPVAYLLGQHNLSVLWIAFPVAELLSLPASLWLWRRAAKALQK